MTIGEQMHIVPFTCDDWRTNAPDWRNDDQHAKLTNCIRKSNIHKSYILPMTMSMYYKHPLQLHRAIVTKKNVLGTMCFREEKLIAHLKMFEYLIVFFTWLKSQNKKKLPWKTRNSFLYRYDDFVINYNHNDMTLGSPPCKNPLMPFLFSEFSHV